MEGDDAVATEEVLHCLAVSERPARANPQPGANQVNGTQGRLRAIQ